MNAEALFQTIKFKVPAAPKLSVSFNAIGEKLLPRKASRAQPAPGDALSRDVSFETLVTSAITAPPRRLHWHHLAVLDAVLTIGVISAGAVGAWILLELMYGFLVW